MFAVKEKISGVLYNQSSSIAFDEIFIGQRQKAANFSAFHWAPHGSLVSIGQHFITTRIVHLPKRAETSLITEADLITKSDQAMWAVHSWNSWFVSFLARERGSEGRGEEAGGGDIISIFHFRLTLLLSSLSL